MKARSSVGTHTPHVKIAPPLLDEHLLNDDFLAELDVAFDSIKIGGSRKKAPKTLRATKLPKKIDLGQVQKTFIELSQNHLKPVTRYLKAIEQGVSSRDLCRVIQYVVVPMVSKTKKVHLDQHAEALVQFQKVLKKISLGDQKKISPEELKELRITFAKVETLFKLDLRGHSTAVLNVLAFYQTLRRNKKIEERNIEKLFGIGIPSISMLRKSSVEEISSLSGIPMPQATKLRELARTFTLFELI